MATAHSNQFVEEYRRYLKNELGWADLVYLCRTGSLRTAATRSISWRILLNVLPLNCLEWGTVLDRHRQNYMGLRNKHIANPRNSCPQDPEIDNPLSNNTRSCWSRYFADGELRSLILKDVERTFPEMEYFQNPSVRKLMCNVLLVYAKENSFLGYKQGMHEILAPLVFILYNDQQAFHHAAEEFQLRALDRVEQDLLHQLHDNTFLEADAYSIFCEVMREIIPWYEDGVTDPPEPHPFERLQDSTATSQLLEKLKEYGNTLELKDPELSKHLSNLDIPAQLYGIRWLRLLFGREFPLPDLLFLWDLIFSDRPVAQIVKCIFLAMLVYIRENLLVSDYGACLQYLMRYPPVVDVASFAQLVLHYKSPQLYPKPKELTVRNYTNITVQGTIHPSSSSQKYRTSSQPPPVKPSRAQRHRQSRRYQRQESDTPRPVTDTEVQILEEQVAVLQQRLNENDIHTASAAQKIKEIVNELSSGDFDRTEVVARLKTIGQQLGRLTISRHSGDGMPANEEHYGPIEIAQEAPMGTPRITNNNEMKEISVLKKGPTTLPRASAPRDRVVGIPRF